MILILHNLDFVNSEHTKFKFNWFISSKDIGLEVNSEKTKYVITSRHQNVIQNQNIAIRNLSFENVEKLKYLGVTVTNSLQ